MPRLLLALALILPLLAACTDTNVGLQAVDQLESLGGAFGPGPHPAPHERDACPTGQTARRCP